ncbi:hypothetical protein [Sodalis ligni]|uniref:YajA protein n=1 Tax=Sodalis ligni TaxID=2697027 RepID=A0A4R1NGQ8_9GAMM|nr:hypothetical protein [Sodalis ligni]TCL06894.1 hypothetical protein EZJ58_5191 [Sodalis ligni]
MLNKPTPDEVRAARIATGMTLKECAERFGYALTSWQQKENAKKGTRSLNIGEYELLLLLADMHPEYKLIARPLKDV